MWNIEKRHIIALEIAVVAVLTLLFAGGYYYYKAINTPLDTVSVIVFDDKNDDLESIDTVAQFQELPLTTINSTIDGEISSVLIKKGDAITAMDPVLTAINTTIEPVITYTEVPKIRYNTVSKEVINTINTPKTSTIDAPKTDIYNDMMREYNTKKSDLEAQIKDIEDMIMIKKSNNEKSKMLLNGYCSAFPEHYRFMMNDIKPLFISDTNITNPDLEALGKDDMNAKYVVSKRYKQFIENSTICSNDCQECVIKLVDATQKHLTDVQMLYKNSSTNASNDTINTAYYKIEAVKNGLQKLLDKAPSVLESDAYDALEIQKKELVNALETLQKPILEYDTMVVNDVVEGDYDSVDAVEMDYETIEEVYYEDVPNIQYEPKDALAVVKTPFSGVVEEVLVEKGMIKEGDEIAKIRHADDVQMVLVALDEQQTDMLLYATGATLQLTDNTIPITLEQLQMGLKRTKNGSTIRLEIPTLNGIITGQTALMTINLSATPLPTIPRSSIISTQNGYKVRVAVPTDADNNDAVYTLEERFITVNKLYNDVVEVSDGLAMGDMVLEYGGDYEVNRQVLVRYKEVSEEDIVDDLPAIEAVQNSYTKPQKIDNNDVVSATNTADKPLEPLSTERPKSSFDTDTTPLVLQKKLQERQNTAYEKDKTDDKQINKGIRRR